jgi:hypothetical protein
VLVEETFARSRLVRIGSRGQQEGSRKMRSNRRKNWFIKRIALGFAVAAFVAPVAQASVDEGIPGQPNAPQIAEGSQANFGAGPHSLPWGYKLHSGDQIELTRAEQPRSTGDSIVASDYGMPRAMPHDYALASGDQIEVVRSTPNGTPSDKIEFVRTQPRSIGEPQVVASGFDWKDAGMGAGLALALVLLGVGAALASRHVGRAQTA